MIPSIFGQSSNTLYDKNPCYSNVQTYVNLDLKPLYKIPGYLIMEQTAQVSSFSLQKSFICVAFMFKRNSPALDHSHRTESSRLRYEQIRQGEQGQDWTSHAGWGTKSNCANGRLQGKSLGLKLSINKFPPENKNSGRKAQMESTMCHHPATLFTKHTLIQTPTFISL